MPDQAKNKGFIKKLQSLFNRSSSDLFQTPEMAAVEYEIIAQHLLEIMRTAQAKHQNLGYIRTTTFFGMLAVPAYISLELPQLLPEISSLRTFLSDAMITSSFVYLMAKGVELNTSFEIDMATQTRISNEAERLLGDFQRGAASSMSIYQDVDYMSLRNIEKEKINKKVQEGTYNYDLPTQSARKVLWLATSLAVGTLCLRTEPEWDIIKEEARDQFLESYQYYKESVQKLSAPPQVGPAPQDWHP